MRFSERRLKIKTRNGNKIIAELMRKNIALSKIKREKDYLSFTVKDDDYTTCKGVLNAFNIDFRTVSISGALRLSKAIKAKAAVIIGLIAGLSLLYLASTTVVKVKLTITDERYLPIVEQLLSDNGLYGLNFKNEIDTDALELKIISSIDEVTDASVSIRGMALNVSVVAKEEPLDGAHGNRTVITASDKAIVTRICVKSGTAVVKTGERVEIGQPLIEGYIITNKDEYAENPAKTPCAADGEVYGKVYYHKRIIVPERAVITVNSGNSVTVRSLAIGNRVITKPKDSPYASYEKIVRYTKLTNILPISVTTITYNEIIEKEIERAEYRELMTARAIEEIMAEMPIGAVVLDGKILQTTDSIVDVYYEVEQRIDM